MLNLDNINLDKSSRQHRYDYTVSFPKMADDTELVVIAANLLQEEMSHDILTVKIKGHLTGVNRLSEGDPVKLTWSIDDVKSTWVGYVYLIENATYEPGNVLVVTCIGNSYSMKNARQAVYSNCTADVVASKIARLHGLKADTTRHTLVFKQISQTGQSDWQTLLKLAKQCGYGFRVENDKLIFKSRSDLHARAKRVPRYFKFVSTPTGALHSYLSVYDFKPQLAEQAPEIEGSGVSRSIGYLANNGVSSAEHSKKYNKYAINKSTTSRHVRDNSRAVFTKIITSEVAPTASYSKTVLQSIANSQAYRYRATARLRGDSRVRPYDVLYLDGLPDGMYGYWNVISVRHRFGEANPYYLEVEVGSDALGEPLLETSALGTRDVAGELEGFVLPPSTDSFVLDGSAAVSSVEAALNDVATIGSVVYSTSMYEYITPDFSEYASNMKWRAL